MTKLAELPEPLPLPTIDSHTHLDTTFNHTGLTVEQLLHRANQVNVTKVVQIGCDLESSIWSAECASQYDQVIAAVAIHPTDAARAENRQILDSWINQIDQLASSSDKVRAVGETGLDYYWIKDDAGRETQQHSFQAHIDIANRHELTLVIHDREAHDDVLAVLAQVGCPEKVIMHCFSGDAKFARKCLDRGFYLSFPGVVTFKNAQYLREALQTVPLDRLLVETDAPFMTPEPCRGRKNASYLIPHLVRFIAKQRQLSLDVLCQTLFDNAVCAYGGEW